MSALKFGQCHLCPKDSPTVRIYGIGVCAYHLAHPEDDQSKVVKKRSAPDAHKKVLLNQFFKEMALRIPGGCENCGRRLPHGTIDNFKVLATMAHIVPKRHFESVMVHPDNLWYACQECHDTYDNAWVDAVKMKVWPIVAERFKRFMNSIKDTELQFLPDALRLLMPNPHP